MGDQDNAYGSAVFRLQLLLNDSLPPGIFRRPVASKLLHSGDEYRGFGILRGKHLLMLALSFGMFWWTFKMFMKGPEMTKVNVIMAIIIAISVARANWGMESFMRFIQFWAWGLMFLMFYRALKGQGGGA